MAIGAQQPLSRRSESTGMVAQFQTHDELNADWELAVMELKEPIGMRSIARSEGGYVDEISGAAAAWTPSMEK